MMATSSDTKPTQGLSTAFIALFLISTGMTTLAVAGTGPILPLLQAHFADTAMAASLSRATLTVGSIGVVVGSPLAPLAAAWLGRQRLLILTACVFTLAGACGYLVDDLMIIVGSRFIVGVCAAVVGTVTVTIVAEACDEVARNRWMGLMVGFGTFLAMVLLPLSGVLGDLDWRASFLLHLLGVPVAVLAWLGYPKHLLAAKPAAGTRARLPLRLDLIALGMSVGTAINVQPIYAPFKLAAIGVHSAAVIGLCLMPFTLAAAIVSPFFGRVRGVMSASRVFGFGFGILATGLLAFALSPSLPFALSAYGLFGAAMGLVIANLYAVASEASDSASRSSALGQALAGYYAAPLMAQVVLEIVAGGQPTHALMWLAGFCALMCAAWLTSLFRLRGTPTH
jgi:MFS family permease